MPPLEVRREPPARVYVIVACCWVALVAGLVVALVNGVLALEPRQSAAGLLQDSGLGLLGLAVAVWGGRRAAALWGILRRDVVLRLDDDGITLRSGTVRGDLSARLAWDDLVSVELSARRLGPPVYRGRLDATVLRFVPRTDEAVQVDAITPFDRAKAAALDLTPPAAMFAMVLTTATHPRAEQTRAWLAEHRPDVPFGRPPGSA